MKNLPNELWILIISQCNRRDAWLGLRQCSRQLRDCVEQYFEQQILPEIIISLPMAMPIYDIRQRIGGRAIFRCLPMPPAQSKPQDRNQKKACYLLAETQPARRHSHFLTRWGEMRDHTSGFLDKKLLWKVELDGKVAGMWLKNVRIMANQSTEAGGSLLSFDWHTMMTVFERMILWREEH